MNVKPYLNRLRKGDNPAAAWAASVDKASSSKKPSVSECNHRSKERDSNVHVVSCRSMPTRGTARGRATFS
eukprot:scaffold650673_cov51-Prasinocladus_malaysianus.AAC.1